MSRGDFRGSISTVIQAPNIQVQNTQGGYVDFRAGTDGRDLEMSLVMQAVRDVQGAAESNFMSGVRESRQLKAEEKQAAEEAQRKVEQQERLRSQWKGELQHKRYIRDMEDFMKNIPEEDLGLSVDKFNEKYKDNAPKLDLTEVNDSFVAEGISLQAQYDTETFHKARISAFQKGRLLRDFTSLADDEAELATGSGSFNVEAIVNEGKAAYLNEAEIWTALSSTAQSQLALGNTTPVTELYQYAAERIENPQLRDKVLDSLQPLYTRATTAERAKKTISDVLAVKNAKSFEELETAFNNSAYEWSAEEKVSNYSRIEREKAKESLLEGAKGIAEVSGDLSQMEYALTRSTKVQGQFGEYDVGLNSTEAAEQVDNYYRQLMQEDPQKAAQMVKYSTRVPNTARRSVNDLFNRAITTGELDAQSPDFVSFMMMDNAVGEERTEFINKFKLEGTAKKVYTQYHLEKQKGVRASNEDNLRYAIQVVKQAEEHGYYGDVTKARTKVEELLESDGKMMSPRQRTAALRGIEEYSLTADPETAAKLAFADAKSLSAEFGDYTVDNGKQLQSKIQVLMQDYYNVTPDRALATVIRSVTKSDSIYMEYDDESDTLEIFDVKEMGRYRVKGSEIPAILEAQYKDQRHDVLLKKKEERKRIIRPK